MLGPTLHAFIDPHLNHPLLQPLPDFASKQLKKRATQTPRTTPPSVMEVEAAIQAPFHEGVFGVSLRDVVQRQPGKRTYPRILIYLVQTVLHLQGPSVEGLFRVPADPTLVYMLKTQLEFHRYPPGVLATVPTPTSWTSSTAPPLPSSGLLLTQGPGKDSGGGGGGGGGGPWMTRIDPHVPAAVLKLWLRELLEPLIPDTLYDECLAHAQMDDPKRSVMFLKKLPRLHLYTVQYLISFLQYLVPYQPVTKMSAQNLAMVFAPSFLRCPSNEPFVILEKTKLEQQFLRNLIHEASFNIDITQVDWESAEPPLFPDLEEDP
ncbi:Rho GTPase activating protein 39 [Coelomomyces lativittatus]|nr:Rho GTPase activating protein 39 [Coelomomyces lativittatus]